MKPKFKTALWGLLAIPLLLSACSEREVEGVDYLPVGHPADPALAKGKTFLNSSALRPENLNIEPDAKYQSPSSLSGAAARSGPGTTSRRASPPRQNPMPDMNNHRGSH